LLEKGLEARERILAEALALFAAKGYESVAVQDVCQAAGLTKPTLYHYFGSKLGLLEAILEEVYLDLLGRVEAAAHYAGDLPLTLYKVAGTYFDFARQRPQAYRLLLSLWLAPEESESLAAVRSWNQRQHQVLVDMFAAASQDHGNMKGRQARYALTFLGMLNTLIGVSLNGLLELSDNLTFQCVHQFMHGIYS
jgi:AcrR family transcriptional regulator